MAQGGFNRAEVAQLLVESHRRCCICHRFSGVKIEIDHIEPRAEGGTDDIENAIPVCFECHAEIHSYNPKHPRGRKFQPKELQGHKEQWLGICRDRPSELLQAARIADVGPIQALVDELEFNAHIASNPASPFLTDQFARAIAEGALSMLPDRERESLIQAYGQMKAANHSMVQAGSAPAIHRENQIARARTEARTAHQAITAARDVLRAMLGPEGS